MLEVTMVVNLKIMVLNHFVMDKSYGFVIVDDYSRFTWVYFLAHKDEALHTFIKHCKKVQNEKGLTLVNIRTDHGGKFDNYGFEMFCNENDFGHNFFAPRTP